MNRHTNAPCPVGYIPCLCLSAALFLMVPADARGAGFTTAFTYQVRLTESGGPANGAYDLTFALFDAASGGNQVGATLTNLAVTASNSLITLPLDFGGGAFGDGDCWLQIGVRTNGSGGAFALFAPRQLLTPTPHAILAASANALNGTLPDSQLSANVARLGSNQTFTGTASFNPPSGPPFTVGSTNKVSSLNADLLDGLDSSAFWKLGGNSGTTPGANFLGTSDNQPLEFRVNNLRALRLESHPINGPNVVGGALGNFVASGYGGSTIGGGGNIGLGYTNSIRANLSTIGGGHNNTIQQDAYDSVIAGGGANTLQPNASYATIGGGFANTVQAQTAGVQTFATIAGGLGNTINSGAVNATIGGGRYNQVQSADGTVGGGYQNVAGGGQSVVAGGYANLANNQFAAVGGGGGNSARGDYSVIAGGNGNTVFGFRSGIFGGQNNTINSGAHNSTVVGGVSNSVSSASAVVVGGSSNVIQASAAWSVIGGGNANVINNSFEGAGGSGNYSTIGGGLNNLVGAHDATIAGGNQNRAGGAQSAVGGGYNNYAYGVGATVGGGWGNHTANWAAVPGGQNNLASGDYSAIGGGTNNIANGFEAVVAGGANNFAGGYGATIPGGLGNTAGGNFSFAAGFKAQAGNSGAFVWSDGSTNTTSTSSNQFMVRASGGVIYYTGTDTNTGVSLAAGSGSWSSLSDRNAKDAFAPVNPLAVLEKVATLPMQTWHYKAQDPSIRHLGPVAQDFYAAFGVGEDEHHITTIDSEGVALAAIQGLHQILKEKDGEIEALKRSVAELKAVVNKLTGTPDSATR